ncbi:MAG: hypothetical protein AB7O21_15165 [Gammaproteobacteria bacterium]
MTSLLVRGASPVARIGIAIAAAGGIGLASPASATVLYTPIAHSDDPVFADLRATLSRPDAFRFAAPAINVHGEVSFLAGGIDDSFADTGLFTGAGGSVPTLRVRADGNRDDPANPFESLGASAVPISSAGDVAFGAALKGGGIGLFRNDGLTGLTTTIATDRAVTAGSPFAPGAYDRLELRPSMNGNGDVVFSGVYGGGAIAGMFRGADPSADRILDTTLTSRQATYWLDPVIAGGGVIGALTENFDPASRAFFNELIALLPGVPGETVLASTTTALDQVTPPTLDINVHRQAVVQGRLHSPGGAPADQQILVFQPGASPRSVADAKFGSTGSVPFRSFEREAAITGNGVVAFAARSAFGDSQLLVHQLGRTSSQGPVYAEVLSTGRQIDGRTVRDFAFTREGANDRGEFAFIANFTDGTSGVYKANFGSTPPGTLPRPGLRAEVETRRYDFATNTQTVVREVDSAPVPGRAATATPLDPTAHAAADVLNDATGSHLKAMSRATSNFASFSAATVAEASANVSAITHWRVHDPDPTDTITQETISMLMTVDGTLLHEVVPGPSVAVSTRGRLRSPGGMVAHTSVGTLLPRVPLLAELALTVNANVRGGAFNAFGAYASLRNGELIVGGDWDASQWVVTGGSRELRAEISTFQVVTYTVNYEETFALEFLFETFASTQTFFGTGAATADFGNTARFALSTRSGAPLVQLGSDGLAVVPLPAAWLCLAPACLALRRRGRTVALSRPPSSRNLAGPHA